MTKKPRQVPSGYEFLQGVHELDERVDRLKEETSDGGEGHEEELRQLERERDEVLASLVDHLTAYQRVKLARHPHRPQARDYIKAIFEDFVELHGDHRFGDDKAIITGFARIDGRPIMLVAQHKGRDTKEKMAYNFGMPNPEGYRKALAKMELAEKFRLPVVCMIDTLGAAPGLGAEERGQAMAIAENIWRMSGLRTPIVILITGEGCSGGALGIGIGDRFAMMENAYYSVISPEGCAAILWRSGEMADRAAEAMKLTAQDMLSRGIIDEIVREPLGGAQRDPEAAAASVKDYLVRVLDELTTADGDIDELLEKRYQRYRRLGEFQKV